MINYCHLSGLFPFHLYDLKRIISLNFDSLSLIRCSFADVDSADATFTSLLRQQSWFLKSLAVELRITSLNKHRSHMQRLISALLEGGAYHAAAGNSVTNGGGGEASGFLDLNTSSFARTAFNISSLAGASTQQGNAAVLSASMLPSCILL